MKRVRNWGPGGSMDAPACAICAWRSSLWLIAWLYGSTLVPTIEPQSLHSDSAMKSPLSSRRPAAALPVAPVAIALLFATGHAPVSAELPFSNLFNRTDRKVVSAEELSSQEGRASALFSQAQQQEQAGNHRKARDSYKSIVNSYPRTEIAGEAQFRYARLREHDDKKKAFDDYKKLITNYRNTPHFNEAIQRQFAIAESLQASKRKGFLGIGAAVQPSKLIEMYQYISEAAPYTEYAPRALLNAGLIHKSQGEDVEAVSKLQSVVDSYADTPFASDAQYEIYQIRGIKAENSNSPNRDRAQVEAGLDFVSQNPNDARAQEIQSNLQEIEARAVEKDFTTGQYYEKTGNPKSAKVYYKRVLEHPGSPYYAQAQQRIAAIDNAGTDSTKKKAGFFAPAPLKKDKTEMRSGGDEPVPLTEE